LVIECVTGILITIDNAFIEKDWHVVRVFPLERMQNRARQLDEAGGIEHRENQDHEGMDDVRKKWLTQDILLQLLSSDLPSEQNKRSLSSRQVRYRKP